MSATPQQIRARRAAADRCPPLECGRRDPLARQQMLPVGPAGARVVHELTVLRRGHTLWLMADKPNVVKAILTRLGIVHRWDHAAAAWTCPAKRLEDVVALSSVSARPAFRVGDVLDLAREAS